MFCITWIYLGILCLWPLLPSSVSLFAWLQLYQGDLAVLYSGSALVSLKAAFLLPAPSALLSLRVVPLFSSSHVRTPLVIQSQPFVVLLSNYCLQLRPTFLAICIYSWLSPRHLTLVSKIEFLVSSSPHFSSQWRTRVFLPSSPPDSWDRNLEILQIILCFCSSHKVLTLWPKEPINLFCIITGASFV